ncbi:MAG: restriction endonuclease [Planctomycetota bacterium]
MITKDFANAYYIKLGEGGMWEADSINTGKMRIGWGGQSVKDINDHRWEFIEGQLRAGNKGKPPAVATTDLNGLRIITESTPDDVWVTFYQAKLWWARLTGPVEQDEVSKFRRTLNPWSDKAENGKLLVINDLPGKISQIQGFRGTVCRVHYRDLLQRTLSGTRSELARAISTQRTKLVEHLTKAIKELHWKDFEILTDLVFRAAGWIRVSVLGQHAKAYDLELREPVTGDRFIVQVKSRAGIAELNATISSFSPEDYQRIFFVVHSPRKDLADYVDAPEHLDIVSPERLAELAIDAGLIGWIEEKVV